MFTRQEAITRLRAIFCEYSGLLKEEYKPETKEAEVIRDLMRIVITVDLQAKNLMGLADMFVEEARGFEHAIMSCAEGRELVAHLRVSRPELFVSSWRGGHA